MAKRERSGVCPRSGNARSWRGGSAAATRLRLLQCRQAKEVDRRRGKTARCSGLMRFFWLKRGTRDQAQQPKPRPQHAPIAQHPAASSCPTGPGAAANAALDDTIRLTAAIFAILNTVRSPWARHARRWGFALGCGTAYLLCRVLPIAFSWRRPHAVTSGRPAASTAPSPPSSHSRSARRTPKAPARSLPHRRT
jgi:hypothetical protein